jgi:hypothetical protein
MIRISVLAAVVVAAAIQPAWASVVSLSPSQDNTLFQDATGSLSGGASLGVFAGATAQGLVRRGLMEFDVASAIPAGSTVTSVSLTLHVSSTPTNAVTIGLERVLASWGEGTSGAGSGSGAGSPATPGDATWLHRFYPGTLWSSPGGDFSAATEASRSVAGAGFYSWSSTPAMVATVQSWLDAPGTDFGWALIGGESTPGSAKRFDSREIASPEFRPLLQVTYTPGPSAAAALGLGLPAALMRRRPRSPAR